MTYKKDQRGFTQFLQDILDAIDDVERFIKGMEFDEFSGDKKTIYTVMKALEIVGEATKNLPDILKNEYPDIPWKFMAGIRDKVVHGYFVVDLPIIWSTAKKDLPSLKPSIEEILEEIESN
jgi:uncharacterized protein with HEPN domain